MSAQIEPERSLIPSCDVDTMEKFEQILRETHELPGVSGYKIGFMLALLFGLPGIVEKARAITQKPLIYDHQKGGTDIPDMGKDFARLMRKSGVDYAILFPMSGPVTLKAWYEALREEGIGVIVGGLMTHRGYSTDEGGFLEEEAPLEIYRQASMLGVSSFVVPGTKSERVREIREIIESEGIEPEFFAPGFGSQGGDILQFAKNCGKRWHIIVGRSITGAKDIRRSARELIRMIEDARSS